MSDRDEQLEVLRAMWGEMKTLNARVNDVRNDLCARIDGTNARLDSTNARLAELREYVGARIDATNERLDGLERRVDDLEQRAATPAKPSRRPRR